MRKEAGAADSPASFILKKNYVFCLKEKLGELPKYTGKILAVGISYERKTKIHNCRVERLE